MKNALVAGLTALSLAASGVAIAQPAAYLDLAAKWLMMADDPG